MQPDINKIKALMESKGWSEPMFSRKLGIDYSYFYRILRGERGVGKKFIEGMIKLCENEGLNFREYILIETVTIADDLLVYK